MDQKDLLKNFEAAEDQKNLVLFAAHQLHKAQAAAAESLSQYNSALKSFNSVSSRLKELISRRGAVLGRVGPATIYEFWIDVPGYSGPVNGATAKLTQRGDIHHVSDVKGSTKGGVGGAIVGGMVAGRDGAVIGAVLTRGTTVKTDIHQVDTRRFELEVIGPGFAWSTVKTSNYEYNLRKFRDLVNARGTHNDDIKLLISAQANVVSSKLAVLNDVEISNNSTMDSAKLKQDTYDMIRRDYLRLRLPIFQDIRARWIRSSKFRKVFAALLGPAVFLMWVVYLLITIAFNIPKSGTITGMIFIHIALLTGMAIYYLSKIR